jgi:hypothetical protein
MTTSTKSKTPAADIYFEKYRKKSRKERAKMNQYPKWDNKHPTWDKRIKTIKENDRKKTLSILTSI